MALEHITVLDLTHMVSGPYGTMILSDLGARTIKVEPPVKGEETRRLLENDKLYSKDGVGAYFLTLNRNKESVCIDLKKSEGREVFLDLVRKADVVFDNFSVGVTKRLGIDHESLIKVNPRIITCSVTGFGETGPEINRPAFDQVIQAMGGGMSITGTPETGPIRSGIPMGDLGGGVFGALGVLAALAEREHTGKGQHVDISMLDVQVSLLNYMATMHLMSNEIPQGIGNGHFVHVPYNCYPTQDGHIIIACIGDPFFERFADFIQIPELQKPELKAQPVRFAIKDQIDKLITDKLTQHPTAYWLEKLQEVRIPCGPVNNMAQTLTDPQVLARDMVVSVDLPSGEKLDMPGNPIKLSNAKRSKFKASPMLGQNTDEVLHEWLNYSDEEITHLKVSGIVG
ncbi:CaiB/BaiF CoA transferase family protein [Acinetobacter stercoris]|uniref:Formyl-coenzyme A transferase n=1 Tax=Acinetobacter stercoris TaxID=2126983 RepID=A0A2U3N105_9GAMM|nr:CaiB/BaiF CoA-transferase family protein [Acinetobacter stercoris]SPL71324.1 Formyl-coenzyme A transferase [Acinetobacter stercoris]